MSTNGFTTLLAFCLNHGIPFYACRLPEEKIFRFGAQLSGEVLPFRGLDALQGQRGFVAVPFRETEECPALFIREDIGFTGTPEPKIWEKLHACIPEKAGTVMPWGQGADRETYDRQVRRMIDLLQRQEVRKMVLARRIALPAEGMALAPEWLTRLAAAYPRAFVFLFSVPGRTTWMGATPETFLRQTPAGARTMSLAGTRPAGTTGEWGSKEKEEQAIVTDYIADLLAETGGWHTEGTLTRRAGQVEHLCTEFIRREMLSPAQADCLRRKLHPTPAVCGFPAAAAMEWISRIEGDSRRYYAGYVGTVDGGAAFDWFVNLRSMELFPREADLYVGGGITALSDPEKEWEETVLKSHTLSDIL